jgi:hypothetical protein
LSKRSALHNVWTCKQTTSCVQRINDSEQIVVPFTAGEPIDGSVALKVEMQKKDCKTSFLSYTLHLAYTQIMGTCTELGDAGPFPLSYIHENLCRQAALQWLLLEAIYLVMYSTNTVFRCWKIFDGLTNLEMLGHHSLDIAEAFDLVATSFTPVQDMDCSICYMSSDEPSLKLDNSLMKTRCCHQIFGKGCYL